MAESQFLPADVIARIRHDPEARRAFWKHSYDQSAQSQSDFVFMNLGYADQVVGPEELETFEVDACSKNLYRHIVDDVDMAEKRVLEIGCGRGGGARFIMETYGPDSVVAVDISVAAIKRCRQAHHVKGLSFQVSDAEALPFADGRFDRVINVESSHCYGSREKFLSEVHRVLTPGGVFMFADAFIPRLDSVDMAHMRGLLERAGFEIWSERELTSQVLNARTLVSQHPVVREALEKVPAEDRLALREAFFLQGAESYLSLQARTTRYGAWLLQRPLMGGL
jgi:ubiquinone/menaquinone biosynthesis C-methylase UbiE